jgi:hypothetical protein
MNMLQVLKIGTIAACTLTVIALAKLGFEYETVYYGLHPLICGMLALVSMFCAFVVVR